MALVPFVLLPMEISGPVSPPWPRAAGVEAGFTHLGEGAMQQKEPSIATIIGPGIVI